MIYTAVNHNGPISFRYPRGDALGVPLDQDFKLLDIGKGELMREGNDIVIVAIGNRVYDALSAAERLEKDGIHAAVINARFAKPLDMKLISEVAKVCGNILTVEENSLMGGFGSGVFESLRATGLGHLSGYSLGIPDKFVKHAPQPVGRKAFGIDADGIYAKAVEILKSPKETARIDHTRHVQ
jgi:1-deoxy-D-xylulose-5-phosphate synthase